MIEPLADKLYGYMLGLPHVAPCLLGCGFVRAWLGVVLGWAASLDVVIGPSMPGAHAVLSAGEAIGFAAVTVSMRRRSTLRSIDAVLVACALAAPLGSFALALALGDSIGTIVTLAALLVCGGGYALMLMLWVETYGQMSTERVVLAWSGSYLVNFVIWALLQGASQGVLAASAVLLPLAGLLMLVPAWRKVRDCQVASPGATSGNQGDVPSGGKPRPAKEVVSASMPWLLIAWLSVFGFLYGLGDAVTGLAFSTLPARCGMAIPALISIAGVTFGSKYFDFKSLAVLAILGMACGMLLVFSPRGHGVAAQVLMSVANESYLLFAYSFACSVAYRGGISAARFAGAIGLANIVMLQAGRIIGKPVIMALSGGQLISMLVAAACASIAVVASLAAVYNRDYLDSFTLQIQRDPVNDLLGIAATYGLSPREQAVFVQLTKGASISEIAEALFLAPGTVRAHTSNIYRKMGVHTRAELFEAVENAKGSVAQALGRTTE